MLRWTISKNFVLTSQCTFKYTFLPMKKTGRTVSFPHYLKPGADTLALRWLGNRLKQARGLNSPKCVASRANASVEQIKSIETGDFHVNLGRLREIISRGYGQSLTNLLEEAYQALRNHFDSGALTSGKSRPFNRDCHYSLCLEDSKDGKQKSTPLLIGGDPTNYLWAIPMRQLKGQPVVTELLELAPSRKRKPSGITPDNAHDGVEVIHVIHGTIDARLTLSGEALNLSRRLTAGDTIHFHARNIHQIENSEKSSPALLLIVRLPQIVNSPEQIAP